MSTSAEKVTFADPKQGITQHGTIDSQKTAVDGPESALSGPAHVWTSQQVLDALHSNVTNGLSAAQVTTLQAKWGPNVLQPPPAPSWVRVLMRQILNAMTLVLIAAMLVSFGTQDWIEAGVIALLVVLNVVVGFTQEWKAEKTVAALASVGAPQATVLRHEGANGGGKEFSVEVEEVVPGDIVLLSPGSIVPADGRVLEVSNLEVDEALLTGESLPVSKITDEFEKADIPLGDRLNMVYAGSQVSKGRAKVVIVATGMTTELGKIAEAMERKVVSKETGWRAKWYRFQVALGVKGTSPLQMKLNKIAYLLLSVAILLALIVLASTAFYNIPPSISTYAVATAVSILPASLIAVVSLTLATASRELAKRNALVRRMDAIEGLSIVTDICSDKTGTLTVGKMVLKKVWVAKSTAFPTPGETAPIDVKNGQTYEVETGSDPYYPRGSVKALGSTAVPEPTEPEDADGDGFDEAGLDLVHPQNMEEALEDLVFCASLCNMATIHHNKDDTWQANGDATEVALQVFAHKLDHGKPHLTKIRKNDGSAALTLQRTNSVRSNKTQGHYELIQENPFDSTIKRMSTIWAHHSNEQKPDQCLVYLKGAVERVLDSCTGVGLSTSSPMTEEYKASIISHMDSLAAEGLRVLCLSGRKLNMSPEQAKALPRDEVERDMQFLGLVGIFDPPRPQSRGAVLEAQRAGITVRMLTGDHPATGTAIAKMVGIIDNSHPATAVTTGMAFDALTEDQIDALPDLPLVIARCSPETKVRMIEALHRRKVYGMTRFCIMTGDGVNDSPALKRADVGVAMGLNGSDVAKSVSDIVLADDNFASITRAIRKGRATLMNLSKFLLYLLSGNVAEVILLLIGLAFKNEEGVSVYPISPVAALWINTIAAGPPALALGLEPTAKDAMDRSPEAFKTIFTMWWYIDLVFYGVLQGALAIVSFVIVTWGRGDGDLGRGCNEGYNETCDLLFEARGTCFATLTIMLMLHALECKHLDKSLFQMNLLDNKLLLWSSMALSLSVFPVLYIPRISDYAFLLNGISWSWGIVVGMVLVYLASAELYKLIKRRLIAKDYAPAVNPEDKSLPRFDTQDVRNI